MVDLPAVVVAADLILPVPSQRTQLGSATLGTKLKKFLVALLAGALVAGISAAIGAVFWEWMAYVGYGLAGLMLVFLVMGAFTGKVAPCPYCGAILGAETGEEDLSVSDEAQALWCKKCGEYTTLEKGELRPHAPTTVAPEPVFKSHVFQNGVWPAGCVLCGKQPVRRDDLGTTDVSGAALLVGRLSISTGSVKGLPYCAEHGEAVKLGIDDEKLQLTWRSLPMLRQYLLANAGNAPLVSK